MYQAMKSPLAIVFLAVLSLSAALLLSGNKVFAHSGENHDQTVIAQEQKQETNASKIQYSYTAQPGDSYSLMVRKAIQTHGIVNKINLTPAEIIAAETNLVKEQVFGGLSVGQAVSLDGALVKKWMDFAQALSPEAKANWQYYVALANFNTNNVGQPR